MLIHNVSNIFLGSSARSYSNKIYAIAKMTYTIPLYNYIIVVLLKKIK